MSSSQKYSGFSNIPGGILLLAAFLFCSAPTGLAAEETNLEVSETESSLTEIESAKKNDSTSEKLPCRGLKPINNLDELLYQFYINLDSDCLFKMSAEELEKIWDIEILVTGFIKPEEYPCLRESSDFNKKPYRSEKDAFSLEIRHQAHTPDINEFQIVITSEYYEKHATLFPDGRFPKYLPEPKKLWHKGGAFKDPYKPPLVEPRSPVRPGKYWMHYVWPYWKNSEEPSHRIMLKGYYGVTEVLIN